MPLLGFFMSSPTWWWSWHRYANSWFHHYIILYSIDWLYSCKPPKKVILALLQLHTWTEHINSLYFIGGSLPNCLCALLRHVLWLIWIPAHLTIYTVCTWKQVSKLIFKWTEFNILIYFRALWKQIMWIVDGGLMGVNEANDTSISSLSCFACKTHHPYTLSVRVRPSSSCSCPIHLPCDAASTTFIWPMLYFYMLGIISCQPSICSSVKYNF